MVLRLCLVFTIGESPRAAPNIVIGITFYSFEAGQKLVMRSNYFCRTDNANFADLFWFDRDILRSAS